MRMYEAQLTDSLLKVLIEFSEDWEKERSCHGYRANERSDIEGNRIFIAEDGGQIDDGEHGHDESNCCRGRSIAGCRLHA